MIKPQQPTPEMTVQTLDGQTWTLSEQNPENFTLIVVYRGLHCPVCRGYLRDIDRHVGELAERGVDAIAVSSDPQDRAQETQQKWELANLLLGYGLDLDTAREWGLFVSRGKGESGGVEEPEVFPEPGLFLVKPDGTLYMGVWNTMPFARPQIKDVLMGLDFVLEHDYPARGEA
ncbi:MAG: peroxiredoxin-like family protein [Candidatus Bipolaricaulia bacterium]